MKQYRFHLWSHFKFNLRDYKQTPCEMIVYQDKKGDLFFFGNSVAFCLGYNPPHHAIQDFVDSNHKHSIPLGSGVFLDDQGIKQLTQKSTRLGNTRLFKVWYNRYIQLCRQNPDAPNCPH